MQPCKTGDQPYSDASPNSEFSLLEFNYCTAQYSEKSA